MYSEYSAYVTRDHLDAIVSSDLRGYCGISRSSPVVTIAPILFEAGKDLVRTLFCWSEMASKTPLSFRKSSCRTFRLFEWSPAWLSPRAEIHI